MGEELSCSFCGRMKTKTEVLIAGLDAHICDQCVEQANGIIINESKNNETTKPSFNLESPIKIKSYLDNSLIYLKGSIPGSKNSQVFLRESIKDVRRKTIQEKIDFKNKKAESAKGKKK